MISNNLFSFELVNLSLYLKERSLADNFFLKSKKNDTFFIRFDDDLGDVSFRFREDGDRLKIERCVVLRNQENKVKKLEILASDILNDDLKKIVKIIKKTSIEPEKFLGKRTLAGLDTTHYHLLMKHDAYDGLSGLQLQSATTLAVSSSLPDSFALLQEMFLNTDLNILNFQKRLRKVIAQVEVDMAKMNIHDDKD